MLDFLFLLVYKKIVFKLRGLIFMPNFIDMSFSKIILTSLTLSFVLYAISSFGLVSGSLKTILDFSVIAAGSVSVLSLFSVNKHKELDAEVEVISA